MQINTSSAAGPLHWYSWTRVERTGWTPKRSDKEPQRFYIGKTKDRILIVRMARRLGNMLAS